MEFFNISINELKRNSIPTTSFSLIFEIDSIKVQIHDEWFDFIGLPTEIPSPYSDTKIPTKLKWVLFDTGNEFGHCVLIKPYFEIFKERTSLQNSDFIIKSKKILGKEDERIISKEVFRFLFYDYLEFETRIGFVSAFALNWVATLNIGIDCFKQFFSIIYPELQEGKFYAYFYNI